MTETPRPPALANFQMQKWADDEIIHSLEQKLVAALAEIARLRAAQDKAIELVENAYGPTATVLPYLRELRHK